MAASEALRWVKRVFRRLAHTVAGMPEEPVRQWGHRVGQGSVVPCMMEGRSKSHWWSHFRRQKNGPQLRGAYHCYSCVPFTS